MVGGDLLLTGQLRLEQLRLQLTGPLAWAFLRGFRLFFFFFGGGGGVKYRMLHIPGILDCTYHLHVSCLCAQGSSIAEYLDYSP